jgi:hypothetical protein
MDGMDGGYGSDGISSETWNEIWNEIWNETWNEIHDSQSYETSNKIWTAWFGRVAAEETRVGRAAALRL